jgi:hypothetical protein
MRFFFVVSMPHATVSLHFVKLQGAVSLRLAGLCHPSNSHSRTSTSTSTSTSTTNRCPALTHHWLQWNMPLCTLLAAGWDALGVVAPALRRLKALEQQQQQQQQLQPTPSAQRQEAAEAIKECLLAIGSHIEGPLCHSWMSTGLSTHELWTYAAVCTFHRMTGQQLACLYAGIKQQHSQLQQPVSGALLQAEAVASSIA